MIRKSLNDGSTAGLFLALATLIWLIVFAIVPHAGLSDETSARGRLQEAVDQIEAGTADKDNDKVQEALEKYDQALRILSSLRKEPSVSRRIDYLLFLVSERMKECRAGGAEEVEAVTAQVEAPSGPAPQEEAPKETPQEAPKETPAPSAPIEAPQEARKEEAAKEAPAPAPPAPVSREGPKEAAQAPAPPQEEAVSAHPSEEGKWVVASEKVDFGYDLTKYSPDPEVKFSYGGEVFTLAKPPLRKGSEVWVPVDSLLRKMQLMFLKVDERSFGLIREDGLPFELKVGGTTVFFSKAPYMTLDTPPAIYEGSFYLSMDAVAKVLNTSYTYDASTNTVVFPTAKEEEFTTYSVARPVEAVKTKIEPPKPPPREPNDIRQEFLPPEFARDVGLTVDTSGSYLHDEAQHDRTRQAEWYISGKAYDYTVDGHFRMKDFRTADKQRFKEDGEFLGLYKKDLWFKFLDNNFSIPTLRSQSQSFFGTEVTTFMDPFKGSIVYGRTDNTVAGPAAIGAVRYYGDLVAVRESYTTPSKSFTTQESVISWVNSAETEGKSGHTAFPRRSVVLVTENSLIAAEGLKLDYSYAISNYVPDNKVNAHLMDDNWKAGAGFSQDLYSFKAAYEYVGPQYASIGIPTTYQDYAGWDFSTNYKFTKNWFGSGGARLARNNVGRDPRHQTTYDRSLNAGNSFVLPWEQSANFSWTLSESFTKGGDLDMSGSRYQDWRVDYSKVWGNMSAQLSYDHYVLEAFATATGGSVTDSASLSVFDVYPELNGSYARWSSNYRKTKTIADASYTTESIDSIVGGRLNITHCLSATCDWRVAFTRREAFQDTAMMSLILGGEFKSSPVTTFNYDFSLTDFDLYKKKTWLPKHYTMLFRGRHAFDVATPEKWSKVNVFVYRDLNGNGRYDPGDPGIPKVRVYVVNGRAAFTDDKGYALIEKVVPGERKAKVDLTRMPIDLYVRGPSVKTVTVEPLGTAAVDFPMVKTGSIRGRVYIDKNKNGKYDKFIDEPMPNVRVYLSPELKDTLTFSDGSYAFDYTYPGTYDVCMDMQSAPSIYRLSSREKIPVSLREQDKATDIDFIFSPRQIEMGYFGGE